MGFDVQKIKNSAIQYYLHHAIDAANQILRYIGSNIKVWQVVGDIRLCREHVPALEIVLNPKSAVVNVLKRNLKRKCVDVDLSDDKVWTMFYKGYPMIIYIATKQNFRALELLKTGPESFVEEFVKYAEDKGYTLDEEGFRRGERIIIPEYESMIFDKVGFPYLNPRERANWKKELKQMEVNNAKSQT